MPSHRSTTALAVAVAIAACTPSPVSDVGVRPMQSRAAGTGGMVVTGSPYATEAGLRMLEAGGNAVDAAVAAAFALAVAEPTQSGLGGRTQLLFVAADGTAHGIDGGTEVPAGYDPASAATGEVGHAAVATPGTVAALTRALAEHGTLPLERVVAPSLAWAERGVVLPDGEHRRLTTLVSEEGGESHFARMFSGIAAEGGGGPTGNGAVGARAPVVQPDLAATLRAIAAGGADVFYRGSIARRIAEDMEANAGFVTASDLFAYRALDVPVGRFAVGGRTVVGTYLPASGVTVGQVLAVLDRIELTEAEPAWAAHVAEALVRGFEDRERAAAMPSEAAVAWLLSDSLLDRRAREVAAAVTAVAAGAAGEGAGIAAVATDVGIEDAGPGRLLGEPAFTSHVSVADSFGNVVALTQSLGPTGGARVATPGLGFLYASTLGGYLSAAEPGERPWSSQAPIVVLGEDGRPELVLGGAGARRIVSALVTTLSRVLHRGASLDQAHAAPRLHPTGGRVLVEAGWPVAEALSEAGYSIDRRDRSYFARLNVIASGADGLRGIAQPEWSGAAAAGPR